MPITHFIWDELSDNVRIEVAETGSVTAEYMNEPGQFGSLISQRRNGTNSFCHFDAQGSTRQLSDDSEEVTDSFLYTAFGETVASSGSTYNPFRYYGVWGYYSDIETREVHVRRRTYSPDIGRWYSTDPAGFVDGSNRYLPYFVLSGTDPSGELTLKSLSPRWLLCGGLIHNAKWVLDKDTEQDGYVIQRVCHQVCRNQCLDEKIVDCKNNFDANPNGRTCGGGCYLELWEVKKGKTVADELIDTFSFPSCDRTYGVNMAYGKAIFVQAKWIENNNLESIINQFESMRDGEGKGVARAGVLRSVCMKDDGIQEFWNRVVEEFGATGTERFSTHTWDCCCGRHLSLQKVSVVNEGPPQLAEVFCPIFNSFFAK